VGGVPPERLISKRPPPDVRVKRTVMSHARRPNRTAAAGPARGATSAAAHADGPCGRYLLPLVAVADLIGVLSSDQLRARRDEIPRRQRLEHNATAAASSNPRSTSQRPENSSTTCQHSASSVDAAARQLIRTRSPALSVPHHRSQDFVAAWDRVLNLDASTWSDCRWPRASRPAWLA
jgi:hypothetical protein